MLTQRLIQGQVRETSETRVGLYWSLAANFMTDYNSEVEVGEQFQPCQFSIHSVSWHKP